MSRCVYDNPSTYLREAWIDGRVVAHISFELLEQLHPRGAPWLPFYLNVGRFNPGQLFGDKEAIKP